MRLAHLADLHFGEDRLGHADRLASDISSQAPDAIAVSGDLTARARPAELAAAFAFLASFGMPVIAVPGNHDIPVADLFARLLDPRRAWREAAPPASDLRINGLAIVGLDTTTRGQWHLDWSAGAASARRRADLERRLEEAAPSTTMVVCHHPLAHPDGLPGRRPPRGATAASRLLVRKAVRAVLCGHLHRAGAQLLGHPWPVQLTAPSALSRRGGGPLGWNLVDCDAGTLRARVRHFLGGAWDEKDLFSSVG